ncbi:MAG: CPBP family intramembrane metalloprotease domain-containing protein [Firmicutes bacterium HGW-Firmicutes-1]|jgi:hypothetical protein|nr:MAG: CPBP family intramembrane metalloprotease domain-containing protein [Firmicutes bacterium HGW-Firmicutes-1]
MKKIFLNVNNQLRSGWKISLVLTTQITMISVIYVILTFMLGDAPIFLIMGILQSIINITIVLFMWKVFDKKPYSFIGITSIKEGYKQLIIGMFMGIISISFVFVILLMMGDIKLENSLIEPNINPSIVYYFVLFIFVGISEELFSRGYCMTVLKQTNKRWIVLLLPAFVFSVLHINNPNIEFIGLLNIFLIGLLFAYMFIRTCSIWMPIGYHITWNFFQGNVYGFEVSGLEVESIYNGKLVTSNLLNGGLFGPEGGLLVTGIIILGFISVYIITGGGRKSEFFY